MSISNSEITQSTFPNAEGTKYPDFEECNSIKHNSYNKCTTDANTCR
jgi:hypothetical protein